MIKGFTAIRTVARLFMSRSIRGLMIRNIRGLMVLVLLPLSSGACGSKEGCNCEFHLEKFEVFKEDLLFEKLSPF